MGFSDNHISSVRRDLFNVDNKTLIIRTSQTTRTGCRRRGTGDGGGASLYEPRIRTTQLIQPQRNVGPEAHGERRHKEEMANGLGPAATQQFHMQTELETATNMGVAGTSSKSRTVHV